MKKISNVEKFMYKWLAFMLVLTLILCTMFVCNPAMAARPYANDSVQIKEDIAVRVIIFPDSIKQAPGAKREWNVNYYAIWDGKYLYDSNKKTYEYYQLCKRKHLVPQYYLVKNKKVVRK